MGFSGLLLPVFRRLSSPLSDLSARNPLTGVSPPGDGIETRELKMNF